MPPKNKSNELKLVRNYDAPVKAVWDAWTDLKQVAQWWGPRGFTITTHSKDLRVGGHWRYTMHGPDGVDYPNVAHYLEVEPQRRLVYDHGATDDRPALFRVTVLFSETARGTKMEMTMALATPEAAEQTRKFVKRAGGESTWDRLSEFLTQHRVGEEHFVINRSFPTGREQLFQMWTQPEHLSRWLPTTGAEMSFIRADIRAGGDAFFSMTLSGGEKLFCRFQYREIVKPERIVYTQQFCNAQEEPGRHPLAPTWPAGMKTVVTFTEEGPEQTRVTVEAETIAPVKPDELETFVKGRGGMTQGWNGSFDKLEALLEAADPSLVPEQRPDALNARAGNEAG